jgi:hypothetical protein
MSQNNIIPSPLTSSDALDNSNDDDWKSVDEIQDDLKVINNDGWANFDNTNQNSKVNSITRFEIFANFDFRLFL